MARSGRYTAHCHDGAWWIEDTKTHKTICNFYFQAIALGSKKTQAYPFDSAAENAVNVVALLNKAV